MNSAQWLAAGFILMGGYTWGWIKGFNTAKSEYFYRGKLAGLREERASK